MPRYIVDHLDEAAFLTAEELARRASTSSSTVVRFSQALGFEGYPELQQAAIEEYRNSIAGSNGGAAAAGALFSFDHSELEGRSVPIREPEETARNSPASRSMLRSRRSPAPMRVVIVGVDQMAFFASYLRHTLSLLESAPRLSPAPAVSRLPATGRIDQETLVIILSAGRAHPLLLRAMKLACIGGPARWRYPTLRCLRSASTLS